MLWLSLAHGSGSADAASDAWATNLCEASSLGPRSLCSFGTPRMSILAWPAHGIHCASLAVSDHNSHKADMHKLNTMHRLELWDQELARTWDKTLPCRLRRSSAARLSHGTDFRAGVATHNFHMADRHKWHTMCLPLRCWAKGRHSWHIVSPHCNVDKTISAGVLHGWLVFRGVALFPLHASHVHVGMTCAWYSLRVLGRGRPQLSQGGYAQAKHHAPSWAFGPRICPHLGQDLTEQASQVHCGMTLTR